MCTGHQTVQIARYYTSGNIRLVTNWSRVNEIRGVWKKNMFSCSRMETRFLYLVFFSNEYMRTDAFPCKYPFPIYPCNFPYMC